MASTLVDLEQFFINWAWKRYEETTNWLFRKRRENVEFDISWKRVKDRVENMVYDKTISTTQPHIIFQTQYENESGGVQNNRFLSEKETTSTIAVKLTKGFSRSVDTGISLPLPTVEKPEEGTPSTSKGKTSGEGENQPRVSAEFGNKIQIRCDETSVVEKKLRWVVDNNITVDAGHVFEVQQLIDEVQTKKTFTMDVRLKGTIVVNIRDKKNINKLIDTVQGDIQTIISDMKQCDRKMAEVTTVNGWVNWPFKGMMEIRHGVRQKIKTSGTKIADETSKEENEKEEAISRQPE